MWKVELSQKMKEIDSLQASAKRSNSCRSDITQKAEQYLADRCDLESEVADLGTQVRHSTFIRIASRCAIALAHNTCPNMRGLVHSDQLYDIDNRQASSPTRNEANRVGEST